MKKSFSEKYGFESPREGFQLKSIDTALENRIWNQIRIVYINTVQVNNIYEKYLINEDDSIFFEEIFDKFFKSEKSLPKDLGKIKTELKTSFFALEWYKIYDFIEFLVSINKDSELTQKFRAKINQVLEDEKSGYKLVGSSIVKIIDENEILEIEDALACEFSGVKLHLSNSLKFLSDKKNPDYSNSIKESISAVESIINSILEKENVSLNKGINKLPFDIDGIFKQAIIKMYSWTSASDGIRHATTNDKIKCSFPEAKYMLVICSAFVNYLIAKKST